MAVPSVDPNYVKARAGLLDALKALGPLRAAAVLVGAQGVYEYTREVDDHFAVTRQHLMPTWRLFPSF